MSESLSCQNIWNEVSQIITRFSLLECDKCAIAVVNWLSQNDIPYKILKLKTKRRSDFYVISDRVGANESITENGIHYGVEVLGKVFDNISLEGMTRKDWLNDFHCRSGQILLEELDSL